MPNPIGVTFIPSADNAAQGPQRGALEGPGGSDLAQAFKILCLHLPRVLGAQSLAPRRLLTSPGSAALPPGFNPQAAVIQALLQAMGGGVERPIATYPDDSGGMTPDLRDFFRGENPRAPTFPSAPPDPKITPGDTPSTRVPMPWTDEPSPTPPAPMGGGFDPRGRNRFV